MTAKMSCWLLNASRETPSGCRRYDEITVSGSTGRGRRGASAVARGELAVRSSWMSPSRRRIATFSAICLNSPRGRRRRRRASCSEEQEADRLALADQGAGQAGLHALATCPSWISRTDARAVLLQIVDHRAERRCRGLPSGCCRAAAPGSLLDDHRGASERASRDLTLVPESTKVATEMRSYGIRERKER